MNFFGIGPMELILVMVIALIVFGPGKMPEIGKSLGAAIREFRRASQELTNELTREVELSHLKELKEEVKAIQTEVTQAVPRQAIGVSVDIDEPAKEPDPVQVSEPAKGPELAQEPEVSGVAAPATTSGPGRKSSAQRQIAQRGVAKRRDKQS